MNSIGEIDSVSVAGIAGIAPKVVNSLRALFSLEAARNSTGLRLHAK